MKIKQLFIAFVVAIVWMLIGKDQYGYNKNFPSILGINLFPLIAWTICLFFGYILFSYLYNCFIRKKSETKRLIIYLIYYWILLITVETIGYHVLKIHNDLTGNFEGLPICDCMHAPIWMKVAYFSLGPIYYAVIWFIEKTKI